MAWSEKSVTKPIVLKMKLPISPVNKVANEKGYLVTKRVGGGGEKNYVIEPR
jgi:hypothetical protein